MEGKMKKKLLLLLVLSVLIGFMATTASGAEKVFKWKIQDIGGEADSSQWILLKGMKKMIEEASGGRVQVSYFPAGTLTDPDSIVDAVAKGAIEGGGIIAGMAAHRAPSSLGSEMPFGARDRYHLHEIHSLWGLEDIMREEYAKSNIYLLASLYAGTIAFQSTAPIRTMGDLKGKKIWCTPNTLWLANFGAAITEVPGFDMYTALKLGTIDGFTWTIMELEYFKFKEVVKYIMDPPFLVPAMHLIINMEDWNALGPDLQRRIQDHVDANKFEVITKEVVKYDEIAMKKAAEYGVKTVSLPHAEVDKMKGEVKKFWEEVAGLSPHAKKMVETYRAWLKYKGLDW
jgi:TRAP-type C4-dicarboxylate transport system substrate-binding protein